MLVILRENVENLGTIGDVVKVTDGYARNYLLPRKLVVAADENNLAYIEHHKKALEKKRLSQSAAAQDLAKKLGAFSTTLARKVGEGDKLFGSVTSTDLVEELKKAGFTVDKRAIQLDGGIKTLGTHSVNVKLQQDISATIKVIVTKEE
jgi:large subunit ribosomal protein L9